MSINNLKKCHALVNGCAACELVDSKLGNAAKSYEKKLNNSSSDSHCGSGYNCSRLYALGTTD